MAFDKAHDARCALYWMAPVGTRLETTLAIEEDVHPQVGEMYRSWGTIFDALCKWVCREPDSSSIAVLWSEGINAVNAWESSGFASMVEANCIRLYLERIIRHSS